MNVHGTQQSLLQLRWLLGCLITVVSLPALLLLGVAGAAWMLTATALLLPGLIHPGWIALIPRSVFRWGAPFILIVLGTDVFLHGRQFVDPLVRGLALLLLWRSFQQRTAREEMQHILLGLFLILVTGVLTLELAFAAQLLLFTPIALLQLLVTTLSTASGTHSRQLRPDWTGFGWRKLLRTFIWKLDFRVLLFSAGLYVGLIGLSGILFLLLPRFDIGLSMAGLQTQGRTTLSGFGEEMRLGDITRILQDRRIAFRVDVPSGPQPTPPYWRMLVLDQYDGDGFIRAQRRDRQASVYHDHSFSFQGLEETGMENSVGKAAAAVEDGAWTFYLEPNISRFLPVPGTLRQLRFQQRQRLHYYREDVVLALPEVQGSVLFFQMTGIRAVDRLPATGEDLQPLGARHPLLSLPADPEEVDYLRAFLARHHLFPVGQEHANRSIAGLGHALVELLAERGYSLETRLPQGSGSPLVRWLQSELPGHCEFFAGAMVLLARAADIPARVVVGFHGGDWNTHENYYMVRNLHAHAWVELLDHASGSWLRMDPTPAGSVSAPGREARTGGLHTDTSGWQARVDSLRVLWYRRVVNFDANQQQELVETVRSQTSDRLQRSWEAVQVWAKERWQALSLWAQETSPGRFSAVVGGALLCVLGVLVLGRWLRQNAGAWHRGNRGAWHRGSGFRERRKASDLLRKLEKQAGQLDPCPEAVIQARVALKVIRFGPMEQWPAWSEVERRLKLCRKALRACRARKALDKPAGQTR